MLDFVIGEKRIPMAADALIEQLSNQRLTGTVYLGYPVIASMDATLLIDALLTSLEYGVVVFDFNGGTADQEELNQIRQRQDDLYAAIYQRFLNYKPLRKGRSLDVHINVITLVPGDRQCDVDNELLIVGHHELMSTIDRFEAITVEQLRNVNSAVQRVTTIKPPQRRALVTNDNSRGGIIKRIEAEIANLDRWQKRAAIETPNSPQRIRGLAGSGKTIVLALKAAYLHSLNPEWRIGVTFQTRSLYQQFIDLTRRFTFDHLLDEPDWDNLRILHAWGSASEPGVYSELSIANGIQPKNFSYARNAYGSDEAFGGICQELLGELSGRDIDPIFDVLLIDEAQDFPQEFFELAYHATSTPKRIIWAYDELQNLGVYSMAPPTELFGNHPDGSVRVPELRNDPNSPDQDIVLPVCYRNTPWALTIAHSLGFGIYRDEGLVQFFDDPNLWRDIGYEIASGEMHPGETVVYRRSAESAPPYFKELLDHDDAIETYIFRDEVEQAEWLAQSIKRNLTDDELELRDILIILASPITARRKAGPIIRMLERYDIPAHLAGVHTSRDVLFTDDSVAISSIYRAKGNEAPMVYLVNSQYCLAGYELIKRRNILFTAITRSRAWVRLSGHGPDMEKLSEEVHRVVNNDFYLRFRVPTPPELEKMRRIHRDMTKGERERVEQLEQTLANFAELIERGELDIENLPPDLRNRLTALFKESENNDT